MLASSGKLFAPVPGSSIMTDVASVRATPTTEADRENEIFGDEPRRASPSETIESEQLGRRHRVAERHENDNVAVAGNGTGCAKLEYNLCRLASIVV